jgi:phage/plasmid-associated DNA primase
MSKVVIELTEEFDQIMARRVLGSGCLGQTEYHALADYIGLSTSNQRAVAYTTTVGRFTSKLQASKSGMMHLAFQMSREVRNCLGASLYHDVDMKNAQPNICLQLFEKHSLSAPLLRQYVENRSEWLSKIEQVYGVSTEMAKNLFCRLCFTGTAWKWCKDNALDYDLMPPFVKEFRDELMGNMKNVMVNYPKIVAYQEKVKPEKANDIGSQFSFLAQEEEKRCLVALYEAVCHSGFQVGALLHDGLLVRRMCSTQGELPVEYLQQWEVSIFNATGYRVTLVEKEMKVNPAFLGEPVSLESLDVMTVDKCVDAFDQLNVAKLYAGLQPNAYIYTEKEGWFELLRTNRWKHHGFKNPTSLRNHISVFVRRKYQEVMRKFDLVENKALIDRQKEMLDQMKKLGSSKFISGVMDFLPDFYLKQVEFDMNWKLFGFDNLVLDLDNCVLRHYRPEDYVSISAGYEWREPTAEERELVNRVLDQVFPVEAERNLFKQILSTTLEGRTLERIIVFNAAGRNGKSMVDDLLLKALGDYGYVLANKVLTSEVRNGSNPELANLDKKRGVVVREPQGKFNNSVLKEITGSNRLNARLNHSNNCVTNLQLTLIVEVNQKPGFMDNVTDAEINRLIDLKFRSKYTFDKSEVDEGNHVYAANPEYKTEAFQDQYKFALLRVMIDTYKNQYSKSGLVIPESVRQATMAYIQKSSEFVSWFNSNYERVDDDEYAVVSVQDVFQAFRNSDVFFNFSREEKRKTTKASMIEFFECNVLFRRYFHERKNIGGVYHRNILIGFQKKDNEDISKVSKVSFCDTQDEKSP